MLGLLQSCTPVTQQYFATAADIEREAVVETRSEENRLSRSSCYELASYIPDTNNLEHTPVKYLRLNFHFLNSSDSTHNYNGDDARRLIRELMHSAQNDLQNNKKMWLPYGNETPVLPTRYRYVLTPDPWVPGDDGIYLHYDDELCYYVHKGGNRNLMDRRVIERYGVQTDSVLNVFIMPHHPDSVASPTYSAGGVGVMLGDAIKLAGLFASGGPGWNYRGVFNHEVGHFLGLSHTWAYNDGCDDTPLHPGRCWNRTPNAPCDTMASNNLMDYNARQNAWTPCQIGKIHYGLSRLSTRQRAYLQPRWCILKPDKTIHVRNDITWSGMKDLEGNIVIEDGATLRIQCRVSLPEDARITIQPGSTLILEEEAWLHNACGDTWQGIEIVQVGQRQGKIILQGDPKVEDVVNPLGR